MMIHVALALSSVSLLAAAPLSKADLTKARTYHVALTGQAKTPGDARDADASGRVQLTVDPAGRRICYDFDLAGLATPLMAHIHRGNGAGPGPSVVTLFTGPGADLDSCVMWTEKRLAEIVAAPSSFYVNVATTEFPDGALRGQLAAG